MGTMNISKGPSFWTIHLAYLVFSLSVLSMKYASSFTFGSVPFFRYYLLSLVLLVAYAFFWQRILAVVSLTRAYSWKSMVFIWIFLFSVLLLGEKVSWKNILGALLIVAGAMMVNTNE